MRTFKLVRTEDASGVSGTGEVAEGVQFSNGRCVMCWQTATSSVAVYDNVIDLVNIHGHEGRTTVVFDDNGEVVTDLVTPEEALEEFFQSGLELSADGWTLAIEIDKLLKQGASWDDIPEILEVTDIPTPNLKTLHLVAIAIGAI